MDAVDVAIVNFRETDPQKSSTKHREPQEEDKTTSAEPELIAFRSKDMPEALRADLENLLSDDLRTGPELLESVLIARRKLSDLFVQAFDQALVSSGIESESIVACGCHGQTILHMPGHASWQLLDSAFFAVRSGVKTLSHFRDHDIARGGQGAPLVPIFHQYLFGEQYRFDAAVNIGGISNISLWQSGIQGWDIGPGNRLMDAWTQKHFDQTFDSDGKIARSAAYDERMLSCFLEDPYFAKSHLAGKSTGRERFSLQWVNKALARMGCDSLDATVVLATLTELSARLISSTLEKSLPTGASAILCGGGARNSYLVERIAELCERTVIRTCEQIGLDSQAIESMAFAYLAMMHENQKPSALASVTGASADSIAGAIFSP